MRYGRSWVVALAAVWLVGCVAASDEPTTTTSVLPSSTTTVSGTPPSSVDPGDVSSTTEMPPITVPLAELQITFSEVGSGFDHPVLLVADPDGGSDFVVEQPGRIVRADGTDRSVALDISDVVRFGGERGLLGLAFHPDFSQNRLAYVNYTDSRGRTVIEQYEVHDGIFDSPPQPIITVEQPAGNHNGGMIAFGPLGHLWIGMGDGGKANDAFGNGQNSESLLGSMLRISVPGEGDTPYDIPDSNPFADGEGGAPEVYWTGLRNPWRFAFGPFSDGVAADVWVADVGQNEIEEVSVVSSDEAGANLGWPIMEGSQCFRSEDCDSEPFILPVAEYGHDLGCSITGGIVYTGGAIVELSGHFFYSDFCSGLIRSYAPATGEHDWTPLTGEIASPAGFGVGGDGELYLVSHGGTIYRLERVE